MRTEHILVLVLAGAIGGAGLMKLVQKPRPVDAVAAVESEPPVVPSPPAVVPASLPARSETPAAPAAPAAPRTAAPASRTVASDPLPAQPAERPRPHTDRAPRSIVRYPLATAKPSPFAPSRPATITAQAQPAPEPPHPAAEPAHPAAEAARSNPAVEPPAQQAAAPTPPAAPAAAKPAPTPAPVVPAPQSSPALPPARVEPDTPAPPPPPPKVTLNTGMLIAVRLVDALSSERNAPGDSFAATLDRELVADGFVIAERGARVEGRVLATRNGGRSRGDAELVLELTRVYTSDGQRVPILTDSFHKQMEPNRGQDTDKNVTGGAGTADATLSRKPATLTGETRLTFRLNAPVTLTEKR